MPFIVKNFESDDDNIPNENELKSFGDDEPIVPSRPRKRRKLKHKKKAAFEIPDKWRSPVLAKKEMDSMNLVSMTLEKITLEMNKMLAYHNIHKVGDTFKTTNFLEITEGGKRVDESGGGSTAGSLDDVRNFVVDKYQIMDGVRYTFCAKCKLKKIGHHDGGGDADKPFYCTDCWEAYFKQCEQQNAAKGINEPNDPIDEASKMEGDNGDDGDDLKLDDKTKENIEEKSGGKKSKDKRHKLEAWTKSVDFLIINPSVRRSMDTIKRLSDVVVEHSFIHYKQIKKMKKEAKAAQQKGKGKGKESKGEGKGEKEKKGKIDMSEYETIIPIRIAELFGKKRKIKDQIEELKYHSWHCGVGGVSRITKLCDQKYLTLKQCRYLMIDLHKNAKNMNLLQTQKKEICKFIEDHALPHLESGRMKIVFF